MFFITATPKCTDWRMARAAFQHSGLSFCHTSPKLMSATTSTTNNTTVMSPRHLYQETFSRSRWENKAVQRPGESWPPCGWETTSAEDSAALSVSDVGCWRNLQITTSLSQGQGWWVWRRGAGIALIWSASVLRLSWVRTAPCHPWWYTKTGRLSLISLHADKIHDHLKRCTKKRRSSLLLPPTPFSHFKPFLTWRKTLFPKITKITPMGGNTTTCKRCGNISVDQNSPCSLLSSQESKGRLTHKDHTPTHSQTVMFSLTEPPITTNTLGQPHTSTFSFLREYKSRSTVYTKMF